MTKIWHALQKVLPMQGGYRWVAFIREGWGGSPAVVGLQLGRGGSPVAGVFNPSP